MTLLNQQCINDLLQSLDFKKKIALYCFKEIDSTNRFLKDLKNTSSLVFCCSEMQTAGRGRLNRSWSSPFGENIYFSGAWLWNVSLSQLAGLSLVVGLAIVDLLSKYVPDEIIHIKWPNDIFWQHKKLAGVLIELEPQHPSMTNHSTCDTTKPIRVIIGIGINVNTPKERFLTEKPWCSLYGISGHYFDRNTLVAHLIDTLDHYLDQFLLLGFAAFQENWERVDYLRGRWITVQQSSREQMQGYGCGVNELGQLMIQDEKKQMRCLSSGDISIVDYTTTTK